MKGVASSTRALMISAVSIPNKKPPFEVLTCRRWASPAGELLLAARNGKLILCDWAEGMHREEITRKFLNARIRFVEAPACSIDEADPVVKQAVEELSAYFRGDLQTFTVPVEIFGTDFEKRVRKALRQIPFGALASYAEVAAAAGSPAAARAVGRAVGLNPVSIIIPCHRVVGTNGKLTGYGGGLAAKTMLLGIEGHPELGADD